MQEWIPPRYFWYERARLLMPAVCKVGFKSQEAAFRSLGSEGHLLVGLDEVMQLRKPPKLIAQFVREPFSRLCSMYSYFTQEWQTPMANWTEEQTRDWYEENWGVVDSPEMPFAHFVECLPGVAENHHFRPQWSEHGDLAAVRGRLDRAQPFWNALRNSVAPGLPVRFPHANESRKYRKTELWDEMTMEAWKVYEFLYGKDRKFYNETAPFA